MAQPTSFKDELGKIFLKIQYVGCNNIQERNTNETLSKKQAVTTPFGFVLKNSRQTYFLEKIILFS